MATAASGMEDSVRWVVDRLLVLNTTIRMTEFLVHHFDEIHVIAICLALAYFATGLGILQKVLFLIAMNTALEYFDTGSELAIINVIGFFCLTANLFRSHFDTVHGRRLIVALQYLLSDRVVLMVHTMHLSVIQQTVIALLILITPIEPDQTSPPARWIMEGAGMCAVSILSHVIFPSEDHSTGLEVRILASILICSLASNLRKTTPRIAYLYDFAIIKTIAQVVLLFRDEDQLMLFAIVLVIVNQLTVQFEDFSFMLSLLAADVVQKRVNADLTSIASQDILFLVSISLYLTHYVVDGVNPTARSLAVLQQTEIQTSADKEGR